MLGILDLFRESSTVLKRNVQSQTLVLTGDTFNTLPIEPLIKPNIYVVVFYFHEHQ